MRVTVFLKRWEGRYALVCVSIGAALVAGALAGADVAGVAARGPKSQQAETKDNLPSVDIELVIADAQAIVSKEFLQALKTGPNRKLAVTYFEWSASSDQKIIISWRVVDGPESADAVANEIMKMPVRRGAHLNFRRDKFRNAAVRGKSLSRHAACH